MADQAEPQTIIPLTGELQAPKRGISRRTVLLMLLGIVAAEGVASGITWQKFVQTLQATFAPYPNLPTGRLLLVHGVHSSVVQAMAWSPDGKLLASGSADAAVQVWDAHTGKTLLTYKGHAGIVEAVAWSPDGKLLASASADKTGRV